MSYAGSAVIRALGRLTVDGVGSELTGSGLFSVGEFTSGGYTGTLEVLNGGQVNLLNTIFIASSCSQGNVKVDGYGSKLTGDFYIHIGSRARGTLDILNGGQVVSPVVTIGLSSSNCHNGIRGYGHVTVSGPGSNLIMGYHMTLGPEGTGILDIRNGGSVSIAKGQVMSEKGGQGRIDVDGPDSVLIVDDGELHVNPWLDHLEPPRLLCEVKINQGTVRGTTDSSVMIAHGTNAAIVGPGNYDIKVVYESDPNYCDNQPVSVTFDPGCLTVGGAYDVSQITPADFAGGSAPKLLESSVFEVAFDGTLCGSFEIAIPYDEGELTGPDTSEMRLSVLQETGPQAYKRLEITDVNTDVNVIHAKADSFGKFAVSTLAHDTYVLCVGVHDQPSNHRGDVGAWRVANAFKKLTSVKSVDMLKDLNTAYTDNTAKVVAEINNVKGKISAGDTFIFYINCHGCYDIPSDSWYEGDEPNVTLWNGQPSTGDEYLYLSRSPGLDRLSDDYFASLFRDPIWDSVDKLFIIDACYSGGFWGHIGGLDSGDLTLLPRRAILASAPETHRSEAVPDSGGFVWGEVGQAVVTALRSFKPRSSITFSDLAEAVEHTGALFAGSTGFIQSFEDDWTIPTVVEWNLYAQATDDFYLNLGIQERLLGDLNSDRHVDFLDYSILASRWLDDDCKPPDWCDDADLSPQIPDGTVDMRDVVVFAQHWLEGLAP